MKGFLTTKDTKRNEFFYKVVAMTDVPASQTFQLQIVADNLSYLQVVGGLLTYFVLTIY